MMCERCNKNNANVHIVKVINGVKNEMNLCEKCAKEQESLSFNFDGNISTTFNFQNLITGIMDYISESPSSITHSDMVCENCGTSYSDFKKSGILGCSECYKTFSSIVNPMIRRVQKDIEHVGKLPVKNGKELIEKKRLLKLKEELQQAILVEEYEKAAELRDKINKIKKGE